MQMLCLQFNDHLALPCTGATARGLRAGRPMLILPYNHDQPDNAARAERLGVARTISGTAILPNGLLLS